MDRDVEQPGTPGGTQYGTLSDIKGKNLNGDCRELLLGGFRLSGKSFRDAALFVYVIWFVVHSLADIVYIAILDGHFPKGIGHHYPSAEEHAATVSYTRVTLTIHLLRRCLVFCVVVSLMTWNVFSRLDVSLRAFFASIPVWWESSRCKTWWLKCNTCCFLPLWQCMERCCTLCCCCCTRSEYFTQLYEHASTGRLRKDILDRFGFPLSCWELLHGSVYLTIFTVAFYLLNAPFAYWMEMVNLEFGFTNSLMVSASSLQSKLFWGLISKLQWGVPTKFIFLAVLQYRFGWAFMWGLLLVALVYAQYNIESLAAGVLGMTNPFPSDVFAVGRDFPWVATHNETTPWVSLNRIYFRDPYSSSLAFHTKDKSKGQLSLARPDSGKWVISGTSSHDAKTQVYAETLRSSDSFKSQPWALHADARVGQRSGSRLLDKLYMFARQRRIGISQVYMIDGSHKDVRANAFVAGAGNSSVIGLFDTLFLGEKPPELDRRTAKASAIESLAFGESPLQHLSELMQAVDVEEEDEEVPRHSAPTQAMEDDEIVAILAHELGHAALKHLEQGMVMHSITSFITFAALGWMAHSPVVAASLSLAAPILHVGAGAYDYVVGPPLEGITSLVSKHLVRRNEYQADAYAASISEKYASGLQEALAKLVVNSNQDPDIPLFYDLLHHDHPSFALRWAHIEAIKKNPSQYYSED